MNCSEKDNKYGISVIIPVFNSAEYICKCLDSLRCQTYKNFEVVLVDDGSDDGSEKICDKYVAIDDKFKVFHKKNGGVSSARQVGLDNSIGKYVIHVDPDDWVEPSMLEELYEVASKEDADMVICDFYENIGKEQRYHKQQPSSLEPKVVLNEMFQQLHGSCWNKLVKRVCYNIFNISFPKNIYYCEDLYVNVALLKHPIKIAYLEKAYYHYVQYNDKATLVRFYDKNTYEHDIRLKKIFLKLLQDSKAISKQQINTFFDKAIIRRAFENGYNYYSSKLFQEKYSKFLPLVQECFDGKEKVFLLLSIKGWYRQARFCKMILQKIKYVIVKRKNIQM